MKNSFWSANRVLSLVIIFLGFALTWLFKEFNPLIRLGTASLLLLFSIKVAAVFWQRANGEKFESKLGLFLFLFFWPGILVQGFQQRNSTPPLQTGDRFFESWITFLGGVFLLILSIAFGKGQSIIFNYIALFSILLMIHLGLVEVWADGLRLLGFQPKTLFDRPFLASTLSDFWSRRWNLAFVDMNKLFILRPLNGVFPQSALIFSIFLISGLLHELAISYSDGVSWGYPLFYFLLQGSGVVLEKRFPFNRILVIFWILFPAPLLFTPMFTELFLGGLAQSVYKFWNQWSWQQIIGFGLFCGGFMHIFVLVASLQVPSRLNWKEEFNRLRPLNRKVVWTYGGYILSIIIFMSGISFYLSSTADFKSGSGLLWIIFISLFWWARILIDFFYMSHSDWPEGPLFKIGHVCLTTLFVTMTFLYSMIAVFLTCDRLLK